MLMVLPASGLLIHIYSIGYMAHEGGYYRFFGYLNLFMFFMLTWCWPTNYLLLFVGWEGVGLCSYLLIGFYFKRSRPRRRQESFHREPHRRLRLLAWHVSASFSDFRDAGFQPGCFSDAAGEAASGGVLTADRAAAVRGRLRQVGAVSAVRLAAGCHGRPHAGFRADPRGHDGHRRRLHGGALVAYLHARARRHERGRHHRARRRRFSRQPSAWRRTTSRKSSLTPLFRSSATCSWASEWARTPPGYFT